jgi:hypothetical protein
MHNRNISTPLPSQIVSYSYVDGTMHTSELISQQTLDKIILETERDVLTRIFGDLQVTYLIQAIEDLSKVSFHEIPEQPSAFSTALRSLFGETCVTIEDLIQEQLSVKLETERQCRDGDSFADCIRDLRED